MKHVIFGFVFVLISSFLLVKPVMVRADHLPAFDVGTNEEYEKDWLEFYNSAYCHQAGRIDDMSGHNNSDDPESLARRRCAGRILHAVGRGQYYYSTRRFGMLLGTTDGNWPNMSAPRGFGKIDINYSNNAQNCLYLSLTGGMSSGCRRYNWSLRKYESNRISRVHWSDVPNNPKRIHWQEYTAAIQGSTGYHFGSGGHGNYNTGLSPWDFTEIAKKTPFITSCEKRLLGRYQYWMRKYYDRNVRWRPPHSAYGYLVAATTPHFAAFQTFSLWLRGKGLAKWVTVMADLRLLQPVKCLKDVDIKDLKKIGIDFDNLDDNGDNNDDGKKEIDKNSNKSCKKYNDKCVKDCKRAEKDCKKSKKSSNCKKYASSCKSNYNKAKKNCSNKPSSSCKKYYNKAKKRMPK